MQLISELNELTLFFSWNPILLEVKATDKLWFGEIGHLAEMFSKMNEWAFTSRKTIAIFAVNDEIQASELKKK